MLNVFFGPMPKAIYNTAVYFKNTYKDSWIPDPMASEIIADVDRSKVVGPQVIESPVLGMITPLQLSGGVKTLLLIANDKQNKPLAGVGSPQNSVCCVSSILNFAKRKAENATMINVR